MDKLNKIDKKYIEKSYMTIPYVIEQTSKASVHTIYILVY